MTRRLSIILTMILCCLLAQASVLSAAQPDAAVVASQQPAFMPNACRTPPPGSTPASQSSALLLAVNQFRSSRGLCPLAYNAALASAAQSHSQDMSQQDFFSHTGSNGSTMGQRVLAVGYSYNQVRENLAGGHETAALVIQQWSGSPLHLSLLLDANLLEAGVGYVYDPNDQGNVRLEGGGIGGPYCFYWTLVAAARPGIYPVVINGGAATTNSRQVQVTIPGTAGLMVRFANQPQWAGVPWQNSAPAIPFLLTAGDGPKTVYGQVLTGSTMTMDAIPASVVLTGSTLRRFYMPLMRH